MITVRRALGNDFEQIYPLLLEFNNPLLAKDDWEQLFISHCAGDEGYFGFVLFDQNKIIGFLGLIFSHRSIEGKVQKFCNLTSFIIQQEYRGKGLSRLLFSEVMKLKDYTIITLPPSPKTLKMHIEEGFKVLEDSYRLIPILPSTHFFAGCDVVSEQAFLESKLDSKELKIYHDHAFCKCSHLLIKIGQENCYIIAKKVIRKWLPFAEIHYISDLAVFIRHIQKIRVSLPLRLKVSGLLVEERLLWGNKIRGSICRKFHRPKLFKTTLLDKDKITDNLYTESLILNI